MEEKKCAQACAHMLTNIERFKSFKNHAEDNSSSIVKKVGLNNQ